MLCACCGCLLQLFGTAERHVPCHVLRLGSPSLVSCNCAFDHFDRLLQCVSPAILLYRLFLQLLP